MDAVPPRLRDAYRACANAWCAELRARHRLHGAEDGGSLPSTLDEGPRHAARSWRLASRELGRLGDRPGARILRATAAALLAYADTADPDELLTDLSRAAGAARVHRLLPAFGPEEAAALAAPPVLTAVQLGSAAAHLTAMSDVDEAAYRDLHARAGSDAERAHLLKALTAGRDLGELARFADRVRGRPGAWLTAHLDLLRRTRDGHARFQPVDEEGTPHRTAVELRAEDASTAPAVLLLMARARGDPVYALSLTLGDPPDDTAGAFEARFRREQRRVADRLSARYDEVGQALAGELALAATPATPYREYAGDALGEALHRVRRAAHLGRPAALLGRRILLVTGDSGDGLGCFDPAAAILSTMDTMGPRPASVSGIVAPAG